MDFFAANAIRNSEPVDPDDIVVLHHKGSPRAVCPSAQMSACTPADVKLLPGADGAGNPSYNGDRVRRTRRAADARAA
jgi:hypothetical protein